MRILTPDEILSRQSKQGRTLQEIDQDIKRAELTGQGADQLIVERSGAVIREIGRLFGDQGE